MMNKIWVFLIFLGIITSIFIGNFQNMGSIIIDSTKNAFEIFLNLSLLTCFFSGIFNIAEKSGLIDIVAFIFQKPLHYIFNNNLTTEELKKITANVSANFLGISQAATPLGIEAMETLQKNNKSDEIASRNEILLVLLNATAPTIIPTTLYGLRAMMGVKTSLKLTILLIFMSFFSCFTTIVLERIFHKIYTNRDNK